MSNENVEVVRGLYDALAKGDVPRVFALCHPELEFHEQPGLPWGGVFRGHEGLKEFLGIFMTKFPGAELAVDRVYDLGGDEVLVRARLLARGDTFPYLERAVVRGGTIREIHPHIDTAAMIAHCKKHGVL